MNHSRPSIRKKAILSFYAIVLQYPEALDQGWHRLADKLQDDDPGVVSTTVNIVCELARKNPKPFLPLSPQLFELLNSSSNNWMLIKIVKLFGYLTPYEPRLVRKLLPPIKALISTTPAMSLLYESIHSVISGEMLDGPGGDELARECVDKLAAFLDDEDRNLRYIAFLALVRILPTHPYLVADYQESIFHSIDDSDLSIRLRALDLVTGMASRHNSHAIITQLLSHLEPQKKQYTSTSAAAALMKQTLNGRSSTAASSSSPTMSSPSYRLEIARRILTIGSRNTFANIDDFELYLSTLIHLTKTADIGSIGPTVRDQIIQITVRVKSVRAYAVQLMTQQLLEGDLVHTSDASVVRHAAAFVCAEFAEHVENPRLVIPAMLDIQRAGDASSSTASACVHNAVKLFAHWAASLAQDWSDERLEEVHNVTQQIQDGLRHFAKHDDSEVAERAQEFLQLFKLLQKDLDTHRERLKTVKATAAQEADKKEDTNKDAPSLTPPPTDESTATWSGTADKAVPVDANAPPRGPKSLHLLAPLFTPHPFGPTGEKAQSKVAAPKGLDLRAPIVPATRWTVVEASSGPKKKPKKERKGADSDHNQRTKDKGNGKEKQSRTQKLIETEDDLDDVPIVQLSVEDLPGFSTRDSKAKKQTSAADLVQVEEEMPSDQESPVVKTDLAPTPSISTDAGEVTNDKNGKGKETKTKVKKKKKARAVANVMD